jgi:hypothetical protein
MPRPVRSAPPLRATFAAAILSAYLVNGQAQVTTLSPNLAADAWYFETLRTVESFALNVHFDRVIQAAKIS